MFSCQDLGIHHEGSWYLNNLLGFVRDVFVQGNLGQFWSANVSGMLPQFLLHIQYLSCTSLLSNLLHPFLS